MTDDQLTVIVVEDHVAMSKGIELVLRADGMRIAGSASTVEEARGLLERRRYDVALIDIRLGATSALGLVEELLRRPRPARVVLYTGFIDRDAGLAEAVRMGAQGFVLKSSPVKRLTEALRTVAAGGSYVDPALAALVAGGAEMQKLIKLSPREHEVLTLLAEGLTGQAIAERLFLASETVRTHIRNATTKLGATTRVQAVALLVRSRGLGTYPEQATTTLRATTTQLPPGVDPAAAVEPDRHQGDT